MSAPPVPPKPPSERVALVTGSARGIGRATAEALAAEGIAVVGVDVLEQDAGPLARALRADLADPRDCARVMSEAGPVDILVNNAAVLVQKPLDEFSVDEFDLTGSVNLRAPCLLSQAAVVGMREQGWGRIVNISSVGARTGGVSQSGVYAATKAGLIALTKAYARWYGPYGITANAVAPGSVETAMAAFITPEQKAEYISQVPLRRFSAPAEIAAVVAFLASDAASFVTGTTTDVNGGWVMA